MELPYRIYRGDPHWVPPLRIAVKELLDRAKHPFYANAEAEFSWRGRTDEWWAAIAAILDKAHNRFHGEKAGFFGFFESDRRRGGGQGAAGPRRASGCAQRGAR